MTSICLLQHIGDCCRPSVSVPLSLLMNHFNFLFQLHTTCSIFLPIYSREEINRLTTTTSLLIIFLIRNLSFISEYFSPVSMMSLHGYNWTSVNLHVNIGDSISWTSLSISVRNSTVTSRSPLGGVKNDNEC